ncbi:MAG: phosphoribosyltransferase [Endomicrobiales bacterium]
MIPRQENIRIVSYSNEPFRDRQEAGALLGRALENYRDGDAVVLGIPRGGVIVAVEAARVLDVPFDIVLSRKIGAPFNPEYALGAVSEDGDVFVDEAAQGESGASGGYVEKEKERQLAEIRRRSALYRTVLPKRSLKGRTALVTDDGLATGHTMQAALLAIRHERPGKLVAAVPVASEEALSLIARLADEAVCLRVPDYFMALGQFYERFEQLDDSDLLGVIKANTRQ